ncbi:helix-turn-helix transcriptional regulator [Archangium lansingense]|uniref:Helix-turn-helix transcriptional regulator n=1 Tax=Archangium lansingense TaxID=2995310 RepID=A0ABT4AAD7_9BACT|nr:helix-turn-helix transcriptional regulator [Archangium lansinium]MCY1078536.1 helix-turn-helix transcriptional regulator [Archangium lansinium]
MKGKRGTKTSAKNGRVRTDLSIQIGKAARKARLQRKLTQADVAERVKLTDEVYGRIERGDMTPSTPTLFKLCTVLGLRADVLLGLAGPGAAQAQPDTSDELPPEARRLLRAVRGMDDEQLAVFEGTASGFLKLKHRRERRKRDKAQDVAT